MFVSKSVCAACLTLNEKVKIVFIGYWLSGFDLVVSNIYLRAGFFTSSQSTARGHLRTKPSQWRGADSGVRTRRG